MFALVEVLGIEKPDELGRVAPVFERRANQLANSVDRRRDVERPCHLVFVHALIGLLENRDEQFFLAAEVVINKVLADLAQAHDVVDTRPVISLGGKFLGRYVENPLPRFVGAFRRAVCCDRRLVARSRAALLVPPTLSTLPPRALLPPFFPCLP